MTHPQPASPPERPAAAVDAGPGAHRSRFTRLRAATDRVPTRWFAAIGTTVFLAVTAAFGGLNTVAVADVPVAVLTAGQQHDSAQLSLTVTRAILVDRLRASGAFPADGERLLVVMVEMTNGWHRPLTTSGTAGLQHALRLDGDDREATSIVREDDQTPTPLLQPGVPALLAFTWTVPQASYAAGDEVGIVIQDAALQVGKLLYTGESWGQYAPAAVVGVTIEDIGAGDEA